MGFKMDAEDQPILSENELRERLRPRLVAIQRAEQDKRNAQSKLKDVRHDCKAHGVDLSAFALSVKMADMPEAKRNAYFDAVKLYSLWLRLWGDDGSMIGHNDGSQRDAFLELIQRHRAAQAEVREASGDLREYKKDAREHGLKPHAIAFALKLKAMDPIERQDYFDELDLYCKVADCWETVDL